jgi:hypothetical protein
MFHRSPAAPVNAECAAGRELVGGEERGAASRQGGLPRRLADPDRRHGPRSHPRCPSGMGLRLWPVDRVHHPQLRLHSAVVEGVNAAPEDPSQFSITAVRRNRGATRRNWEAARRSYVSAPPPTTPGTSPRVGGTRRDSKGRCRRCPAQIAAPAWRRSNVSDMP